MKTYIVNDWAWVNCIVDSAPENAKLPWGYAIVEGEKELRVYRTLVAQEVRTTEKAINVKCKVIGFDSRCNFTKDFNWFFWLPKKCLIEEQTTELVTYFDGGESQQVEMYCMRFGNGKKIINAWWDR